VRIQRNSTETMLLHRFFTTFCRRCHTANCVPACFEKFAATVVAEKAQAGVTRRAHTAAANLYSWLYDSATSFRRI